MRYRTIVVDPPWAYDEGWPGWSSSARTPLPYQSMTFDEMQRLAVGGMAEPEAYLFLWTTSRYLWDARHLMAAWSFTPRQVLVWCKPARGKGPGGMFATTTEFVLVGQRIGPRSHARGKRTNGERVDTSWFQWPRRRHSEKPEEFYAMVERVSPGPYLELFARRPRLGWDLWGDEAPNPVRLATVESPT